MSYKNYLYRLLEQESSTEHEQDPQDHVTFDIPLLIRIFELVREDVKTDADLHKIVERILSMKNEGVLTMDHYEKIAAANPTTDSGQEPKEEPAAAPELESLKKLAGI